MLHLIGRVVKVGGARGRVLALDRHGLYVDVGGTSLLRVDPDQCELVDGSKPTLADRLAEAWHPILGKFARERANSVACWAECLDGGPMGLIAHLRASVAVVNRADYGGCVTAEDLDRAAILGAAVVLS